MRSYVLSSRDGRLARKSPRCARVNVYLKDRISTAYGRFGPFFLHPVGFTRPPPLLRLIIPSKVCWRRGARSEIAFNTRTCVAPPRSLSRPSFLRFHALSPAPLLMCLIQVEARHLVAHWDVECRDASCKTRALVLSVHTGEILIVWCSVGRDFFLRPG